jgi:hypothetical protein
MNSEQWGAFPVIWVNFYLKYVQVIDMSVPLAV